MSKRRILGRGLDALIPHATQVNSGLIEEIPVESIAPNPYQPRQIFPEESLRELADSIRQHGILQPIIVIRTSHHPPYQLVAGERRWRAAQLAGLATIPAVVRDLTPHEVVELALIENVQRADLSPLETAIAYRTLIEEFGLTQAEVAERVGKSRSAVANTLRLLDAPEPIQRALSEGKISEGHARALLALPDSAAQLQALRLVQERDLTVRQTEQLVRGWGRRHQPHQSSHPPTSLPHLQWITEQLQRRFQTKVELRTTTRGGRLIIHYYSPDELTQLLTKLLGKAPDELD